MTQKFKRRRGFLKATVLGVPAALLASAFPFVFRSGSAEARELNSLRSAKLSTFSKLVGDVFGVRLTAMNVVPVALVEATALGKHSFSLVFGGPTNVPIDQNTYTLQHDGLGEFPLFIVPIQPDDEARYYEAIVNHENK
jgi:hypothetical protein